MFSPSNKIQREVDRAKDLSAPRYLTKRLSTYPMNNTEKFTSANAVRTHAYAKASNTPQKLMVTALVHTNYGLRRN